MTGNNDNSPEPVIVLQNLIKFFGRFAALRGITDSFAPGRLYVVVGDNGAGKSTLIKMLSGVYQPDAGSLLMDGQPLELQSPRDALDRGIVATFEMEACVNH